MYTNLQNKNIFWTNKSFFQNKIINSKNPSKAAWKVVSQIANKYNKMNNIQLLEEGVLCKVPNTVVSALNNFYLKCTSKSHTEYM